MKRTALTILFLSLLGSTLFAQDRLSDRIEDNLVQLGRKIEQIRILAEQYENQQALKTIQSAKEDFDAAIALLQEWKDSRRFVLLEQARVKYKSANLKADLASRILLFKPAANLLNQLELLIQQAESVVQGSDANDLRYYLNKARNYYKHAQNAFADNRYLRGHEYLKIATYFAEKVLSLAKGNRNSDRGLRFEEYRNNIQMLAGRVALNIDDNDILRDLYSNIQEYLQKADNANDRGNVNRAFANLQIAERLTYRLIDLSEEDNGNSPGQKIEEEYQSLGRYLATLRNEFESANQQSNILNKAEEFYQEAAKNIENKKYQQAATNLKLAQRMAQRAFNILSSANRDKDPGNLQDRLNEVQHLISLQENRLDDKANYASEILHKQAAEFFRLAQKEYEQANFEKASYYLNITLRLLNRNEQLLKENAAQKVSPEAVLKDLNQTEQLINRLDENPSLDHSSQSKIAVLKNLLGRARSSYDAGNYMIAKEIIAIVQNQLANMPDK